MRKFKLYFRAVVNEDVDLIYRWSNDVLTRINSFSFGTILYEDHLKWFASVLERNDVYFKILMCGNCPVGQIRVKVDSYGGNISYSIAPEYRGYGYGVKIVEMMEKEIVMI